MNTSFQPSTWGKDAPLLKKHMGIVFDQASHYATENWQMGMDAQPVMNNVANIGIPLPLVSVIDPQTIRALMTPIRAEQIYGSRQLGQWTDRIYYLKYLEGTGYGVSYGDFEKGGLANLDPDFEEIDRFLYQTHIRWGELEEETIGLAQIALANELRTYAVDVLNRFTNRVYFFGITGQRTYGILNNPKLPAPIQPDPKAAGGTAWDNATNIEIYNDILKMLQRLVTQLDGIIDMGSPVTLVIPNSRQVLLNRTNDYSKPVTALLKDAMPNIRIAVAPELGLQADGAPAIPSSIAGSGPAGNMMQMFVETLGGTRTIECAFPMRLRAHRLQTHASSYTQKMSTGTWGAVIRRPVAIAQMVGI